jgi:uncharacterized protein involved in exopolysaccharide biosynthesis
MNQASIDSASDRTADAGNVEAGEAFGLLDMVLPLARHWLLLLVVPITVGGLALAGTYLQSPVYTARTSLLPPQQQGSASALLGSLGTLASIAGAGAVRTPGDQYVAMLSSQRVADKLVDQFELMKVYESEYRFQARERLAGSTLIGIDKKDGLITVAVEDESPRRAADLANAYVLQLREMTSTLAVTEAQQRRTFFERELLAARRNLAKAQAELQASGIAESTLRAEPRAAAEALSRIRAEAAATEIQLRVIRRTLADGTPEVQQLLTKLSALRDELGRLERQQPQDDTNYIGKYREFKYQESLVEAFGRQYELARLDEQRDGALIQVIDTATVPEWKSKPKRGRTAMIAAIASGFLLAGLLIARHLWQLATHDPATAAKVRALRDAMRLSRGHTRFPSPASASAEAGSPTTRSQERLP